LVVFAVAGLLVAVIQWSARYTDHQFANIGSFVLLLIGGVALTLWWLRHARPTMLRWGPLVAIGATLIVLLILFEKTSFNGELIPQFRYRFGNRPAPPTIDAAAMNSGGDGATIAIDSSSYSGFLGPQRNGRIENRRFAAPLVQPFPQLVWKHPVGGGIAGVAIGTLVDDQETTTRIGITLEQRDKDEAVTCYDLATGQLRWIHLRPAYHAHALGDVGPRSTPMLAESGLVYAQGATGHLWCIDAASGEIRWESDLLEIAGIDQATSEVEVTWGRAASPLLVDDMVVVPMGGQTGSAAGVHSLVAFDATSGEVRWRNGPYQISYASPVVATLAGVRQIVSVNQDFVTGNSIDTGQVLWSFPWPGPSNGGASCTSPTIVSDDQVLLSKGYGGGALLLRVLRDDGKFTCETVWSDPRVMKTKFTNPVVDGDFVYGLSDGTLECIDWRSGESQWKQPRGTRLGHGHILIVEDCIVGSGEQGEIVLVACTPDSYQEIGRFQAIEGKTWNPFSISDTTVVVRNGWEMAVWELAPRESSAEPIVSR
jgi:outer membrane protein assembly factor BamB